MSKTLPINGTDFPKNALWLFHIYFVEKWITCSFYYAFEKNSLCALSCIFLAEISNMKNAKGIISGKNTPGENLNISEILDGMREDQQQFDKKIAELRRKASTKKDKEIKKN